MAFVASLKSELSAMLEVNEDRLEVQAEEAASGMTLPRLYLEDDKSDSLLLLLLPFSCRFYPC